MENKFEMHIHPEVYDELHEILSFLARLSPEAAVILLKEINEQLENIKQYPFMFPEYDDSDIRRYKYRKAVVNRNYIILYTVDNNAINIEFLIDCRKNNKWLLSNEFTLHEVISRQIQQRYQVEVTRMQMD